MTDKTSQEASDVHTISRRPELSPEILFYHGSMSMSNTYLIDTQSPADRKKTTAPLLESRRPSNLYLTSTIFTAFEPS